MNQITHITDQAYEELATRICESLSQPNFYSGTIRVDCEEASHTLAATLIFYRRRTESHHSDNYDDITSVVAVWYDSYSICDDCSEPQINDFDIEELSRHLIGR